MPDHDYESWGGKDRRKGEGRRFEDRGDHWLVLIQEQLDKLQRTTDAILASLLGTEERPGLHEKVRNHEHRICEMENHCRTVHSTWSRRGWDLVARAVPWLLSLGLAGALYWLHLVHERVGGG